MTITIGAWIIPLVLTLLAMGAVFAKWPDGGRYGAGHLLGLYYLMIATILSLATWLIWAVLT